MTMIMNMMKHMTTTIIMKFIKAVIIIGSVCLVLFLILQDMAWTGRLEVQTDFKKFTPFFTILKPQDRNIIGDVAYIKGEPAYFDLYLPRDFDKAILEIEYKNEFGYPIQIGPNVGLEWELKDLSGDLPPDENNFIIQSAKFDLEGKNINNGKLRFIISLSGLFEPEKGVYVKNLKITLLRDPLWQGSAADNLISYLKYAKNQF